MKRSWLLVALFIPLSLLAPAGGFGQASISVNIGGGAPPPAPAPAYSYWFYPALGVYYDYRAHVYFYQDGPNWVRAAHLPPRFHHLGRHVSLKADRGRPWAHYADHRAKYPPERYR